MAQVSQGDMVKCLAGSIDRNIGAGQTGRAGGFARLSSYHPREVMVHFADGVSAWFWVHDVEQVPA